MIQILTYIMGALPSQQNKSNPQSKSNPQNKSNLQDEEFRKRDVLTKDCKTISFPRFTYLSHMPFFLPIEANFEEKQQARFECISTQSQFYVKCLPSSTTMTIYFEKSQEVKIQNDNDFPGRNSLLETMEGILCTHIINIIHSYTEEILIISDYLLSDNEFNDFKECIQDLEQKESWKILQTATINFYHSIEKMFFSGVTCFVHPTFAFIRKDASLVVIFFSTNECISATMQNTKNQEKFRFGKKCLCTKYKSLASCHFHVEHSKSSQSSTFTSRASTFTARASKDKKTLKSHQPLSIANLVEHNLFLQSWIKVFESI